MESWSILIDKEYFKFSAAHFLIFPDGSAERLHGHNYRVYVEIEARLTTAGLIVDFQQVKPVVRELVEELDEYWLLPGEHPDVEIGERDDGVVEVRHRGSYYAAPVGDVRILPINNTSVENYSAYLGRELRERLAERFDDLEIRSLSVSVQETPGQRAVYRFEVD